MHDGSAVSNNRISNLVAECALKHYENNITKGKPKDETEWTVYAAIVAQRQARLWVISAATGTKCTARRQDGFVLHDGHAEVLARRGLMRVLWLELREKLGNSWEYTRDESKDESLLEEENELKRFKLCSDIRLHLYISDSPCGDARYACGLQRMPYVLHFLHFF
jgi:tRNA-specific adenosine deaminase 1